MQRVEVERRRNQNEEKTGEARYHMLWCYLATPQ
jgi:hypothetical protein